MFVEEKDYDILILTLPFKEKELALEAHSFVFTTSSYYHFDRELEMFNQLESIETIYNLLNEKTEITMKMVASIHESIDWMEEKLYEKKSFNLFTKYWLGHKKDLARITRMLNLAEKVLQDFIAHYLKEEDFLTTHFRDIEEHLQRTNRSVSPAVS